MSMSQASKLQSLLSSPTSQLHSLSDIAQTRSWDFSLPTITTRRHFTDRLNFNSDESFFQIFKHINDGRPYRLLEYAHVFDTDNDIVLFGGCLLDIVLNRSDFIRDFDLRLVGREYMTDETKCVAKAREFVGDIFEFITKENEKVDQRMANAEREGRALNRNDDVKCNIQDIVVSRARSTVSVHVPSFGVFQLTFAPTPSVQNLLAACQPHCTRLAVKDGAVLLDHLACFSIESTAIVLDTSSFVNYYCDNEEVDDDEQARRISSGRTISGQLARFIKYHQEKGFDIILPQLEMTKVPRRNLEYNVPEVLPLPCLTVIYDKVDNNSIMATGLRLSKAFAGNISESGLIGSYDSSPAPHIGDAIHHNIRCLVNDVHDSFKYVSKGERWNHVFDFTPSLTPRMVKKSYETVSNDLQSGNIPIARLTGYFSVTPPNEVVDSLISMPLRTTICRKGALPKEFVLDKDRLEELVEMEVSHLIASIENLPKVMVNKGLDKLVCQFPENVSNEQQVFDAVYGSFGMKRHDKS
eukprot:scaffold312_cov52-Cyclotella_meneghiniana.AAC.3